MEINFEAFFKSLNVDENIGRILNPFVYILLAVVFYVMLSKIASLFFDRNKNKLIEKQMNRVISVFDKKTSMRLTDVEWRILDEICFCEKIKRKILLEKISGCHNNCLKLTPAVRLFSLLYLYSRNQRKNTMPKPADILQNTLDKLL